MNVTLRIKRKYFDLILSNDKRIEFRDVKPYYQRLFRNKDELKTLTLHYQKGRILRANIEKIRIISLQTAKRLAPDDFRDSDIIFSNRIYAIYLLNARLIK